MLILFNVIVSDHQRVGGLGGAHCAVSEIESCHVFVLCILLREKAESLFWGAGAEFVVAEELYKYEAFDSKVYLDLLYPVNINGSRMWRGGITEVNGIFSFTSVILSGFRNLQDLAKTAGYGRF